MTTEDLKTGTKATIDAAKDKTREALETARAKVGEAASSAAETLKDEAMSRATEAKDSIASEGERLADTLHDAASREDGDTLQSRVLGSVAGGVSEAAATLRSRSLRTILSDAEAFARRNPGVFVAGAAVAAFALTRFARATTPAPAPAYAAGPAQSQPGGVGHKTAAAGQSTFKTRGPKASQYRPEFSPEGNA